MIWCGIRITNAMFHYKLKLIKTNLNSSSWILKANPLSIFQNGFRGTLPTVEYIMWLEPFSTNSVLIKKKKKKKICSFHLIWLGVIVLTYGQGILHFKYLVNWCKNLLRVLSNTKSSHQIIYGCPAYSSTRLTSPKMLNPIHNTEIQLSLGDSMSPCSMIPL